MRADLHALAADDLFIQNRHSPPHLFRAGATYFVTAKTLRAEALLHPERRREQLVEALQHATARRDWRCLAWVVLPNHYHTLLLAPAAGVPDLSGLIRAVHRYTATAWNREETAPGRQVWYQYWDTCITHENSFFARLNYIHWNPVKHGLASSPEEYPYSSYCRWQEAGIALSEIEAAHPWDRLDLDD